ncbi:hypothetical protein PLANPX_5888 [Lacipirellula parvula]|uniref:Uncharacterized protein n=1 Tax=Lacipirellula parvula TaxID=2650471 RepID=A0A5K7XMX6_9BACT|nr:hypothetical protein PLANPX_5888 [Lacipirellula parvula]
MEWDGCPESDPTGNFPRQKELIMRTLITTTALLSLSLR